MPYIKQKDRKPYDSLIKKLAKKINDYGEQNAESTAGQLNYVITRLVLETYGEYLPNYTDFNEVIGVLECAKMEMYRVHVAPYEDEKIKENGHVLDESPDKEEPRFFEGSKL